MIIHAVGGLMPQYRYELASSRCSPMSRGGMRYLVGKSSQIKDIYGNTPAEIVAGSGEEWLRTLETDVLKVIVASPLPPPPSRPLLAK